MSRYLKRVKRNRQKYAILTFKYILDTCPHKIEHCNITIGYDKLTKIVINHVKNKIKKIYNCNKIILTNVIKMDGNSTENMIDC